MKDSIIKERTFHHSIDTVWNAISRGEEISTWFLKADFKAEKGFLYSFKSEGENCTEINGMVKEADPYKLIYSWIVKGTTVETWVKWELKETENGTQLYLEHSGLSNYQGDTAVKMFESFDKGWDNCVSELSTYLKEAVHAR